MKKVMILSMMFGLWAFNSKAADSTWMLCENGSLVINAFEHRAPSGDGTDRVISFTMIYGGHVLTGDMSDYDASVSRQLEMESCDN